MLPLQNLDDRTFKQLVEESIKQLPRYNVGWTDYNLHDPGITMIEMLAWLTEIQGYYLNEIREENYAKYIKLLGIGINEAKASKTPVCFSLIDNSSGSVIVPKGTRLLGSGMVFETSGSLKVINGSIDKIVTYSSGNALDNTRINGREGLSYYAFGEKGEPGDKLYIGFEEDIPVGERVSLTFDVFEDYAVAKGRCEEHICGNEECLHNCKAYTVWEYLKTEGSNIVWEALEYETDNTMSFAKSGSLVFNVPSCMLKQEIVLNDGKARVWLRSRVTEEYELPPRINSITMNAIDAVQVETSAGAQELAIEGDRILSGGDDVGKGIYENGTLTVTLEAPDYLQLTGNLGIQVECSEGAWIDITDTHTGDTGLICEIKKFDNERKISIIIKNGVQSENELTAIEVSRIRKLKILSWTQELERQRILGSGNGLPFQYFSLLRSDILLSNLALQVEEETAGKIFWRDWRYVEDFTGSKPYDRHFTFDFKRSGVIFGDGINGAAPYPSGEDERANIRITSCSFCGGAAGNVTKTEISTITQDLTGLKNLNVVNHLPSTGGVPSETIEEAKKRATKMLRDVTRAVSSEDYELLACNTPGLRVAKAKALITEETSGIFRVDVVVVPYSNKEKPVPGRNFLRAICCHLDKHRLITTKIKVLPPDYVKITVSANVVFKKDFRPDATKVREGLKKFLSPFDVYPDGKGWPFGRTVYKSEIYETIENIEGVDFVQDLRLYSEGSGASTDKKGNIEIMPLSLVYSGEHSINTSGNGMACYKGGGKY